MTQSFSTVSPPTAADTIGRRCGSATLIHDPEDTTDGSGSPATEMPRQVSKNSPKIAQASNQDGAPKEKSHCLLVFYLPLSRLSDGGVASGGRTSMTAVARAGTASARRR
jgi:hypothetical protein